jgi:hypothetical protein
VADSPALRCNRLPDVLVIPTSARAMLFSTAIALRIE